MVINCPMRLRPSMLLRKFDCSPPRLENKGSQSRKFMLYMIRFLVYVNISQKLNCQETLPLTNPQSQLIVVVRFLAAVCQMITNIPFETPDTVHILWQKQTVTRILHHTKTLQIYTLVIIMQLPWLTLTQPAVIGCQRGGQYELA